MKYRIKTLISSVTLGENKLSMANAYPKAKKKKSNYTFNDACG